jgi:hypothetical protein
VRIRTAETRQSRDQVPVRGPQATSEDGNGHKEIRMRGVLVARGMERLAEPQACVSQVRVSRSLGTDWEL